MKFDILVNGVRHAVEVTLSIPEHPKGQLNKQLNKHRQLTALMDGRQVVADALIVSPKVYSILVLGRSLEVTVEETPNGLLLRTADREFLVNITDPRSWGHKHRESINLTGRQNVVAPMPGKIIRVLVIAGDHVDVGQGLFVIEAMKMQNEIRSSKSGIVERLASEGQTVTSGEILAVVV